MSTQPQKPRPHRGDGAALVTVDDFPCCTAPVAQEPPAPTDDYLSMQRGWKTTACRCTMVRDVSYGGYDGPQPAEWEQADDCPVHPLTPAPGSAQEPADPPRDPHPADCKGCALNRSLNETADPPWLTEAIAVARQNAMNETGTIVRDILPILRAGIEQELREKLVEQITIAKNDVHIERSKQTDPERARRLYAMTLGYTGAAGIVASR